MAKTKEKKLTVQSSTADFEAAFRAKAKLIERQKEDFLFALGQQWSADDVQKLETAGLKPITDNRIQPNIFLLTGLERQNRTDFKAFPEGEEDSIKADIATALFKHSIKTSDFSYKSSDQFKDGITCGESHLELYLDNTHDLLNGKPCWKKTDTNCIFPEPGFREYDFSDAGYVYKLTPGLSKEELSALFPEKAGAIEEKEGGRVDLAGISSGEEKHRQKKDYPKKGGEGKDKEQDGFDLLERYYKKWVKKVFIGDKQTGEIKPAESEEMAKAFVEEYKAQITADQQAYVAALDQVPFQQAQADAQHAQQAILDPNAQRPVIPVPPAPPQRDPARFIVIKRLVPEIWLFAHTPGIEEPLADEVAWFYPEWKAYPFIPFFARFSTAPLVGDDRHLLVQGVVHGVKGVQEKHNKAEMLMLRHMNSSANGGWLTPENAWSDRKKVESFGTTPGVNLEYKGNVPPTRIFPMQLSEGHHTISAESAEAIKAQLGINADLLATQEGGADSGRAIALRQRQGLLMVQELFDNLSRSRIIAGRFLLSQLGKVYDTETAKKVLGEAFLAKNFPPPLEVVDDGTGNPAIDPATGQPQQQPMVDPKTGGPMTYDAAMAEVAIAEVLSGNLWEYDVTVGEAVASETTRLANSQEVKDIATAYPGLIPPDILIGESQLPQTTKNAILSAIKQAQAAVQPGVAAPAPGKAKKGEE